jgi:plasmid maintenance system antidote protein VapI
MSPDHPRIRELLKDAVQQHGSLSALARALGWDPKALRDLIRGKRFVSVRQALDVQALLGVPARDLLIEAAIAKIDEELAKAKSKK